jgi:hypothetical protein
MQREQDDGTVSKLAFPGSVSFAFIPRPDLPGQMVELHLPDMAGEDRRWLFAVIQDEFGVPRLEDANQIIETRVEISRQNIKQNRDLRRIWTAGADRVSVRRRGRRKKIYRKSAGEPLDLDHSIVQLLAGWYETGGISLVMLRAGNRFANEVRAMHEPTLNAMDMARVRVDNSVKELLWPVGGDNRRSVVAVRDALAACGGTNSRLGSLVAHVLGRELSLRRWCEIEGARFGIARPAAANLLKAALEVLAVHYGTGRQFDSD